MINTVEANLNKAIELYNNHIDLIHKAMRADIAEYLSKTLPTEVKALEPGAIGVEWYQYTQYYNDGEECYPRAYIRDAILADGTKVYLEDYGYEKNALRELTGKLGLEAMLDIFGPHVRVEFYFETGEFKVNAYLEHD